MLFEGLVSADLAVFAEGILEVADGEVSVALEGVMSGLRSLRMDLGVYSLLRFHTSSCVVLRLWWNWILPSGSLGMATFVDTWVKMGAVGMRSS